VHVALQALQDLVAERIQASLWGRLEVDAQGRWRVNYPAPEPLSNCPLCPRAGLGDAELFWLEETGRNSTPYTENEEGDD